MPVARARSARVIASCLIDQFNSMYCPAVTAVAIASTSPAFLDLAAHPIRWRLLSELSLSDLKVRELAIRCKHKQGLVSYHLARLRLARIVAVRRSAADGRDAYYSLDLTRCSELLTEAGATLHPALRLVSPPMEVPLDLRAPVRVLFLCSGNSARSQMAEALIERMAPNISASSAGSRPKPLHPNAVRAMLERGIDISNQSSKNLDEFRVQQFDVVITLCDRVREVCPDFPDHPRMVHWSLADPAAAGSTDGESYPAFEAAAAELTKRIAFLIPTLAQPDRTPALQR